MMEKVIGILQWKYTPIGAVVVAGILDEMLFAVGLMSLSPVVCLVMLMIAGLSVLINFSGYGKILKRVTILCCLLLAVFTVSGFSTGKNAAPAGEPAVYTPGGSSAYGYTGRDYGATVSFGSGKSCGICNDTKKCHVCNGRGDHPCSGMYCVSGKCQSCRGTGIYSGNGRMSKCIVCNGDGICDICDGTRRMDCSICHGNGKCTHCR